GNLSWGIPPPPSLKEAEAMPIRGSPNGAAALVHAIHTPGRHGPESVDAINRNGGWTSCAGIGGRHQPVRAGKLEGTSRNGAHRKRMRSPTPAIFNIKRSAVANDMPSPKPPAASIALFRQSAAPNVQVCGVMRSRILP